MDFPAYIQSRIEEILERSDPGRERAVQELCHGHPEHAESILRYVNERLQARRDPMPTLTFGQPGERRDVPEQIGPYKILEPIGEGGMGTVYLAEQVEELRRRVALKLIRTGMDSKDVIARFEIERRALALMSHANIARVYDAGQTTLGQPYFAMEYVPGVPITQFCDAHRLTVDQRLDLMIDVCSGIHHAHENGIIHRDIKPSNVLVMRLDGQPVAKIIDFGVAKAINQRLTQKTIFTQRGLVVGTPEYMSPEQAEMAGTDVDTRSDVYSLGVLLYELLVGELPFDSQSLRSQGLLAIQRKIREDDPPRPSTRLKQLGSRCAHVAHRRRLSSRAHVRRLRGPLDWMVMKALEKDPARRYPTAAALANDIARFRQNEPVSAGPTSRLYRLRTLAQRHQTAVVAGAVAFVVLGAAFGMVYWQLRQTEALVDALARKDQELTRLRQRLRGGGDPPAILREALSDGLALIGLRKKLAADSPSPDVLRAARELVARRPIYEAVLDDRRRAAEAAGDGGEQDDTYHQLQQLVDQLRQLEGRLP